MQVLGFHFVKNAKNKEILNVTGSNPVQYVRTATSMHTRQTKELRGLQE